MTEKEWATQTDVRKMLVFLEERHSDRKARLFACSMGRSIWPFLGDERSQRVIEIAENYVDGLATEYELNIAHGASLDAIRGVPSRLASTSGDRHAWQGARLAVISLQQSQIDRSAKDWIARAADRSRLFVQCIFGDPFRPVRIDPDWLSWRESTVEKLAQTIYDNRRFDLLPILADALHEAGCCDDAILGHCRGPNDHVRGCWVVDAILGKQ
ncbi:MAG: hypothetical protein ACJ8F7_04545 [Gemmataceae bacterium]